MCWQCCLCLSIFSYKIGYFYEELQAFVCGSFLDGKITGKPFQATMQEAICVVWNLLIPYRNGR